MYIMYVFRQEYCKSIFSLFIFTFWQSSIFLQQFIFTDCRTGLSKNNEQCVFMNVFAAICFHEVIFQAK